MERDSYLEGIRSAWLGERFGEVFFDALAERTEDESLRNKWQTLARLEHVTGMKMAALLESHGEEAVTHDSVEVGEEILSQYTSAPHLDAMMGMKDVVEKAIVRFDQLLAVAPESDVPAVQFLVAHEQALLDFVEHEIAGNGDHALDATEALLSQ